jgi:iron(III) transport system permease protein
MQRFSHYLIFALIVALFASLFIWPIWQVVSVGLLGLPNVPGQPQAFTLNYVGAVFQDPALRAGLMNSALLAVSTTFVCILIATPLAVLSTRYNFVGKGVFSGLLLVPLILPPFVGAIGLRQLLGRNGALTALAQSVGLVGENAPVDWLHFKIVGIVLIQSLSLYPILYLNLTAALSNIDPAMQQAAANLGASRWTIFRRITLPLMRPGMFAGATIVLIWSFTELGTPLMFDFYSVTPVQIFQQLSQVDSSPIPYALVIVMLCASVGLYVLGKFVLGRGFDAAVTKASVQSNVINLSFGKGLLAMLPFAVVAGLALLPHLAVILMSVTGVGTWYDSVLPKVFTGQHYNTGLTHPLAVPSVQNSIVYAACSTVIDMMLGLGIAWVIVRSKLPGWMRSTVDSLAMLPLAVPGLVMAFGYLAISLYLKTTFKDIAWLKSLVDVQQNPMLILVIAYAMRRLPYVVRSAVAGLQQTPVDLELAARNLGASPGLTLRRITVPLIGANLIAGGLLAFAFAMLEVSDSLILAQRENAWPITKAIYELFQRYGDGPYIASALGVWAMVLLTLTILSASAMLGKKMGAIFRV